MTPHLIAIDMDGTLLNSRNQITQKTLSVLRALLDRGHLVVWASGRSPSLLPKELKVLHQGASHRVRYGILENGSYLWDYENRICLCRKPIPQGLTEEILRQLEGSGCYTELFVNGEAYADAACLSRLESRCGLGDNFIRYFSNDHHFTENLSRNRELVSGAEKINVYFEDPRDSVRLRTSWNHSDQVSVTTSVSGNAEFQASGCTKGAALTLLAEKLGIPQARIISIGDNENDLEMFAASGCAAAMGNAAPHIKDAAHIVIGDNDHDGAALFLEKYLLS